MVEVETLQVAAAVIKKDGRVLIAQRPRGSHMGLKWEFPGGKIEPGEDAPGCLVREIKEELDLDISVEGKLTVVEHQYGDRKVVLHCYWCRCLAGEAWARDCHDFKWVTKEDLNNYDFAGADQPVVQFLIRESQPYL